MALKRVSVKVITVKILILHSSDPIRGIKDHWESKNCYYRTNIHQKLAFLPLYAGISTFLLPNHVGDSKMMEHQKI